MNKKGKTVGKKKRIASTPATRLLKSAKVDFELFTYPYKAHGGTSQAAQALEIDEHSVIKTLVMQTESKAPLIVLMHGDYEVSLKNLARAIGAKTIAPCTPETAQNLTGYRVGGISPFGTLKKLPVYGEQTIQSMDQIFINAGKRGLLVKLKTGSLCDILDLAFVNVGLKTGSN